MFKSIQIERAHYEVAKQIARRIVAGDLEPGEYLPAENELTNSFEVSRVVVREALRSLDQRGLIEMSQGRRTVVRDEGDWDIFDAMVLSVMREEGKIYPVLRDFTWIRQNVEPKIAAAAAQLNDDELVAALKRQVEHMEELYSHHEGYYRADLDFHARLAQATGNKVLFRLIKVIGGLFHDMRPMPDAPYASPKKAIEHHRRVVNAIEKGQPDEAEQAMKDHIEWTMDGVFRMYASGEKLRPE